jgi:hypothetical protein
VSGNDLTLTPPLTIGDARLDGALGIEECLSEVERAALLTWGMSFAGRRSRGARCSG